MRGIVEQSDRVQEIPRTFSMCAAGDGEIFIWYPYNVLKSTRRKQLGLKSIRQTLNKNTRQLRPGFGNNMFRQSRQKNILKDFFLHRA